MSINNSPIRVMVVDDHDLVRHGIVSLLGMQPNINVVAQASSGEIALDICRDRHKEIQIVLMDISMPGMGGLEATHRISKSWPDIGIIILSMTSDGPLPKKMLKAGARGYLTKGIKADMMVEGIKQVVNGGVYIDPHIANQIAKTMITGEKNLIDSLSKRELQVMMLISQGMKTNEIADTLHLSPKTVSTYRKRLHEKLEVDSDIEMVNLARQHGLLESTA